MFRHSSRNDPLNVSIYALSVGLPGRDKRWVVYAKPSLVGLVDRGQ
jgi:hypothetical protein